MNSWDVRIASQISEALTRKDLATVRSLLRKHPGNLLDDDGNDFWLARVAGEGWLKGVKALVDLGVDVNASANIGEGTQFYHPEGPIFMASVEGHVSVVKWLLENGAQINFVVNGKPCCMSLWSAIRYGHFAVVKLLVEHGADLHAIGVDGNATTLAEHTQRFRIRDFLVSQGGKDLRDTTPHNFCAGQTLIDKTFAFQLGAKPKALFQVEETEPCVRLKKIKNIVYTVGLSDRLLPTRKRMYACSELLVSQPIGVSDETQDWARHELIRLVRTLDSRRKWFSKPVVASREAPSELPFRRWLIHKWDISVATLDHRVIDVHELVPLFDEESRQVSQSGVGRKVHDQICEMREHLFDPERSKLSVNDFSC